MFANVKRIFALLIGNHLMSSENDVKKMKELLINIECHIVIDCNPQEEILKYISSKEFDSTDLLIIYYSGHGKFLGRNVNGKMEIVSTWLNSNMKTYIFSDDIDTIFSNLKCNIFLISDSCHSGRFGDFYKGNNKFLFLGSSSITNKSKQVFHNKNTGILVHLLDYVLTKEELLTLTYENLSLYFGSFYKENKIKIKGILKYV